MAEIFEVKARLSAQDSSLTSTLEQAIKTLDELSKLAEAQGLPSEEKPKNKLVVFNNDLIPVYTTDKGQQVVIGRELHDKLGIGQVYPSWFERMCEEYDLEENTDFFTISTKFSRNSEQTGRPKTDHILTLDTAKEIAMVQESPIGKAIRRKLIEIKYAFADLNKTQTEQEEGASFSFLCPRPNQVRSAASRLFAGALRRFNGINEYSYRIPDKTP